MERTQSDHEAIRALNDEMRQRGPERAGKNKWLLTPGLIDLGPIEAAQAIEAVRTFTAFDANNDPYGEHDFAAFDVAGARLFWKIDYYDLSLDGGSPDPTDSSVTVRVLTIMLASEY
jgi:uncharacterized protein DUF3768